MCRGGGGLLKIGIKKCGRADRTMHGPSPGHARRHLLSVLPARGRQVENRQLVDFQGDYEYYLSQNEDEAVKMEAKEEKLREIEKDNIKAKSKVRLQSTRLWQNCAADWLRSAHVLKDDLSLSCLALSANTWL